TLGVFQVEGKAPFATTREEPTVILLALRKRWHLVEIAVRIAGTRRLDLHHVCSKVGHHGGGGGAEHEASHVEDADSIKDRAPGGTSHAAPMVRSLRSRLRADVLERVSGQACASPSPLAELGGSPCYAKARHPGELPPARGVGRRVS